MPASTKNMNANKKLTTTHISNDYNSKKSSAVYGYNNAMNQTNYITNLNLKDFMNFNKNSRPVNKLNIRFTTFYI